MNAPLNIDFVQILLHALNLVILIGGLGLILYRPVSKFLRERRDSIEQRERECAESKEKYEQLKTEYEEKLKEADVHLAQLRREAEREMAERASSYMDQAKERAGAIIRDAEDEAEQRKEQILESAQTEIGELVLSAAQKLLNDSVTPETDSALYDEFLRTAKAEEEGSDE